MKTYRIDLELPEEERWAEVIENEARAAKRLVKQSSQLNAAPDWALWLFQNAYRLSRGRYAGEIDAWASALKISNAKLTAAQCSYELAMAGGYLGGFWSKIFGCTSVVVQHPELGPAHVRYLDWDLKGIKKATRIFWFHRGSHEFVSVGIPGFIGVLSGMVPGAYSVSINQAPASQRPGFDMGAAFLVREVLTHCETYEDAVDALTRTQLAAPVFFTVCGTKKDQACVIERLRDDYFIRHLSDEEPLVATNHHVVRAWEDRNDHMDADDYEDSTDRLELAEQLLGKPRKSLRGIVEQLAKDPIYSGVTVQRMAFNPKRGELYVAR